MGTGVVVHQGMDAGAGTLRSTAQLTCCGCFCAGILNLMMLVLVCANARLIVENLLKYGVLANPAHWLVLVAPDGGS